MHSPPKYRPGRKKKPKIKKEGHNSWEKRFLSFPEKKASFEKTQHSAHHKL
jgi:hypothetical protein